MKDNKGKGSQSRGTPKTDASSKFIPPAVQIVSVKMTVLDPPEPIRPSLRRKKKDR